MSAFNAQNLTASSAYVESYFADVKKCINEIPCSLDIFAQKHIDLSEGALLLGAIGYPVNEETQATEIEHHTANAEMSATENWRGKGIQKKNTKKSVYVRPAPQWTIENIEASSKRIKFAALKNAMLDTTCSKVHNVQVSFSISSAFDSVCQLLAAALAYNQSYRQLIAKDSVECIYRLADMLANK